MRCPACMNNLTQVKAGEITVDVCHNGCGGIWFDNFELKKVDEQHEKAGDALLNIPRNPNARVDTSLKRECPRCEGVKMKKHLFDLVSKVEVDSCGVCGGVWLDAGELGAIRGAVTNEAERKAVADRIFSEKFAPMMASEHAQTAKEIEEARRTTRHFGSIFNFFFRS